ncbi:hypothetical protein TUBRATIS_17350 [Tubulinosema ratisbonensis]|uniref:Uncharacterized protein n=1 Tax=Tubulinosema ratisbonensis TaxID=291195 RepID=A0A437AKU2_9MICR|nr:hypothetical protein TUBRATIS_17350 [Tubulinosema ratisbonensis]
MQIKDLQSKKEHLENQLKELKSLEKTYSSNVTNISLEINRIKHELIEIQNKKENFRKNLEKRNGKIVELKEKLTQHKEKRKEEQFIILKRELKEKILEIENLNFFISFSIFNSFKKLKNYENKFLKNEINKIYKEKKEELIEKIESLIEENLFKRKKLNSAFYYFKLLISCELFFSEQFFDDYFFKKISDKFTFHFLSDKETNRLDKPEWLFKFLKEQLFDYFSLYLIFKKDFFKLLEKVEELIKIKLREIFILQTDQKRKLVWHFYDEFILYINEINKFLKETMSLYKEYIPKLKENTEILLKIEQNSIKERINKIHKLSYKKWFEEYKLITKETFHFCKRFGVLESNFVEVLVFLLTNIKDSYEMFVDEMRFSSESEIILLCEIYSQIEQYKYFLQSEENELLIINPKLNFSVLQKTKNNFFIFNQQNFKTIKELLSDEVNSKLRNIRNFNYVDQNTVVSFVIDLSNILSLYKKCTSFSYLERMCNKILDTFLLERIILSIKLTSEQSFKLKDLVKRLNDLFDCNFEMSFKGVKCLECIFDGKFYDEDVKLYEKIKAIYD